MEYKNLNEIEKNVFNNIDFILANLREKQGEKSFRKVLELLRSKYGKK
jgi:hypothetical protein